MALVAYTHGAQHPLSAHRDEEKCAVTRIRTGVAATTTQSTNHYTITALRFSLDTPEVVAACVLTCAVPHE